MHRSFLATDDLNRNKKISDDLFELAMVVLSATQVSVERSYQHYRRYSNSAD